MKILLDESLPRKLASYFGKGHEVLTVRDMEWLGKKNGELLNLIQDNKFEIFVTVDRNLPYQQNLDHPEIIIFILCANNNRLETLRLLIPKVLDRISEGNLQNVIEIS